MKEVILLAAFCCESAFAAPIQLTEAENGDFEEYVLAVSWQPSFCQYKYHALVAEEGESLPAECNPLTRTKNKWEYLTAHGLWPSLPKSIAKKLNATEKIDERWRNEGCAVLGGKYQFYPPNAKCKAPNLLLNESVTADLKSYMPGANPSSCLERYEYAKHGACFGYDQDEYFAAIVQLVKSVRNSSIGGLISDRYGESFTINEMQEAIKSAFGENAIKAFEFACSDRSGKSNLDEIRITLAKAGLAGGLGKDGNAFGVAKVVPKKTKCGKYIYVDTRGF